MISKRARYALHGIGFLAHKHPEAPISFTEILAYLKGYSKNLSFSSGYIKKIFQDLSRAGIVRAIVGRKGGYALGREPRRLPVIDVVTAVDGFPVDECCLLSVGGCDNRDSCGVYTTILGAQRQFTGFLGRESAESLARKMFNSKKKASRGRRAGKGRAGAGRRKKVSASRRG